VIADVHETLLESRDGGAVMAQDTIEVLEVLELARKIHDTPILDSNNDKLRIYTDADDSPIPIGYVLDIVKRLAALVVISAGDLFDPPTGVAEAINRVRSLVKSEAGHIAYLDDELQRLIAAVRDDWRGGGWQEIALAPLDGTNILGECRDGNMTKVLVVFWSGRHWLSKPGGYSVNPMRWHPIPPQVEGGR
jgi:hypothetical protein